MGCPNLNAIHRFLQTLFVSRLDGVSITPTFAHKFDNKWSAAVGAEINYVRLTMEKNAGWMINMDH